MKTRKDIRRLDRHSSQLSWFAHVRATLALGLPLVGAQLAQMAINVTDTVMIGWLGPLELAAAVLATQTYFLFWLFGVGLAQAVMPLAAAAEGQRDVSGVRRSVRMGLWVIVAYSACTMVPLWHTEAILLLLGQRPEVASLAGSFMRILQWSMFASLIVMVLRSYLSVLNRAHVVLWATVAGAILNAGFDYALIFGHFGAPRLGMFGAAIASLGTGLFTATLLVVYTLRRRELHRYEIYVRFWRPDWPAFLEVLRLGWPIGATILAEAVLFTASSLMMGWLGTVPLAAHGIALQLSSIAFMIPLGLANAATIRVGLALGRQDQAGLVAAASAALGVAVAIALIGATLFWTMPETLIGLYLDRSHANAREVLGVGAPLLMVAAAFQLVDALQVVGNGSLRGLKDTRAPMVIAMVSYWLIGMPAAYLLAFPLHWGGVGIWTGLACGLLAAAVLMNWRFFRRQHFDLLPQAQG
jgi:MATE family multidrug resistance protein